MLQQKIAELDVLTAPAKANESAVILLHGYGADQQDLAPLHQWLDPEGQHTWLFPNAPLAVPIGPHMVGRAWFPIDMRALEMAAAVGGFHHFAEEVPEGFLDASQRVVALLDAVSQQYERVYLGGFSQGAMLACETLLAKPRPLAGLILLSTTLIAKSRWLEALANSGPYRFFQSHGRFDPLLSYGDAEQVYQMLTHHGWRGEFHGFDGGHEIPTEVLLALKGFLRSPSV